MKKISSFRTLLSAAWIMLLIMWLCDPVAAQQSYTFTPAGATGSAGPTQNQVNTAYQNTNLSGNVTVSPQGYQNFTIPVTGPYRIEARGGQGYGTFGGRGAIMIGDFTLTAGTVLKIIAGQMAGAPIGSSNQFGGGGGSFVTYTNNVPLVVAGGGGGSWASSFQANSDGTVVTTGNSGLNGAAANGAGGTNGSGGATASFADGGAGISGNGGGNAGGLSFSNGATGGADRGHGGFGGGGGTSSWDNYRGGGGGGYSGGGASASSSQSGNPQGGGGGSINNGANQTNVSGANLGQGKVIITELCPLSLTSSASNSLYPVICSGTSLTLTTNGVSNYSWSTGNTSSSVIVVSPTVTTTYSVIATTSINCTTAAFITVTVSQGLPVLSVNSTTSNVCLGDSVTITASGALTYSWSNGISNGVKFKPLNTTTYSVAGQNGCGITNAQITVSVSPLQIATAASTNVVCASNPATITAGGASSYTWTVFSQTVTGTSIVVSPPMQTVFTVTGSIGGCIGTASVMITTKANPTVNIAGTNTMVCAGGTVGLVVTGATTYTWVQAGISGTSVVVSPSVPTLYQVAGTNSLGCTTGANFVVVTKPSPTLVVTSKPAVICAGANATLTVTGADTYSWTTGGTASVIVVNPNVNTVYQVAGSYTDTGCASGNTVAVTVFVPLLQVSPSPTVCPGTAVTLTTAAASGHLWSNGSTAPFIIVAPPTSSLYTVSAMVTGSNNLTCMATSSIFVGIHIKPIVTAVASRTSICRNERITLTAGGADTYHWLFNNSTSSGTTFSSNIALTYTNTVIGTDVNGCKDTNQVVIKVNQCTGLDPAGMTNELKVYPNPSAGRFVITATGKLNVAVYSELGQHLRTFEVNVEERLIDLSDLAPGIYFIRSEGNKGTIDQKIVIER